MIYKDYLALILIFSILSCEPAGAFQIGSPNEMNSEKIIYHSVNDEKNINKNELDVGDPNYESGIINDTLNDGSKGVNHTSFNDTLNDGSKGVNHTSFNDTLNDTKISNESTDLNNTLSNDTSNPGNNTTKFESEESTKDKVTDTLFAVGYASAAIAAACAMNPEPLVSKIVCGVAVTVAVVSFVAVIFVKWIW